MQEPDPPEAIPDYVLEGVQARDTETLALLATYVDELITYRRQRPIEVDEDEELVDIDDEEGSGDGTKVIKKVPCGKDCNGCPHGPYEYRVHREGRTLRWEYVGPA